MLISKIGQFNRVNNSKTKSNPVKSHNPSGNLNLLNNNPKNDLKEVSFNGLGSLIKKSLNIHPASTGKYPLNLRDLKLRLAKQKNDIYFTVESPPENFSRHKWVNEYSKKSKMLLKETMFTDKGKHLKRVSVYEPNSENLKMVIHFKDDGKSFKELELYKDGVKTKSVYFENNKRKSVTDYSSQRGIESWTDYEPDGKTVKSIIKPKHTELF